MRVGALSNLDLELFDPLTKKVLVEFLLERSIDNKQVDIITTDPDWSIPFIDYLLHGVHPDDPTKARRIKIKAPQFVVRDTQLYKRGYLAQWLKRITNFERIVAFGRNPCEGSWRTRGSMASHSKITLPRGVLALHLER